MLYSFRLEVLSRGAKNLADARIIVSHGLPRPWHVQGADAWLAAHGFEVETL